ncbi:MAG: formate dehydrogenase accessory protein FdhE [Hyphomicrobiaceae bacterium]
MSEVGGPKRGLMNIGEEAKPPFAVLPDPQTLFLARSKRLDALASEHQLAPYLTFLAALTRAQHEVLSDLPAAVLPPFERIGQALEHGMPPVSRALFEAQGAPEATLDKLLVRLAAGQHPVQTAAAIQALQSASPEQRRTAMRDALKELKPSADIAQSTLVAAALQVHFARLAAMLVADDLKPVADGACPTCGSAPMTSSVVGWPKAHNTRFCTCALCATMWHVVRVKCVLCGTTEGIGYLTIEGQPDTIKAETCDACRSYVKVLYQVNDPNLEPLADDVATLGLDMLLADEGWKRGGQNPFLMGY